MPLIMTSPYRQLSLILDNFPGALFAFSTRQMRNQANLSFRVRRSSDNGETDIGFDSSGNLNEAQLSSFVGANDGYIATWYDQSGNGNDISESTTANQPVIVESGTIYKENGLPALKTPHNSNGMDTGISGIQEKSVFVVAHLFLPFYGGSTGRLLTSYGGSGGVGDEYILDRDLVSNNLRYFDGGSSTTVTGTGFFHQLNAIRTTSTISVQVDNGTPGSTSVGSNTNSNNFKVFEEGGSSDNEVVQSISELIFYNSDQTSNKAGISLDQKTYFGTP
jgi:hypothetical protein